MIKMDKVIESFSIFHNEIFDVLKGDNIERI